MPAQLKVPPRPPGTDMLWRMFLDLSAARRWTDFAQPLAIEFGEIAAWSAVNSYQVSLNDLALLQLLDNEFRKVMIETEKPDEDDDWSTD